MSDPAGNGIQRVGLLGWPISHSVSPAMHNAAFEALGLNWMYDLLPIQPGDLMGSLSHLIDAGYRGFNVTVPHKRAVLESPLIGEVDPVVEEIGAANTLTVRADGRLRASNTDWQGFSDCLAAHHISAHGRVCVILGTGGSSKGVGYALKQSGAQEILWISRDPDGRPDVIRYDQLRDRVSQTQPVIINCTPLGMHPAVDESPWPDGIGFPQDCVVIDLIYNPPVTMFMQQARMVGAQAIGGLGMLVWQGALSFELWTGIAPPLEIMERAAKQALEIPDEA